MMRVFTLGISMPVSMMVVHTSTSMLPSAIRPMTRLSSPSAILPWAVSTVTPSPSSCCRREAAASMFSTRLCR